MTEATPARISDLHPGLTWAQKGLLDFIHDHTPTLAEVIAGSSASKYATQGRLKELKKAGLIKHKQEVLTGRGVRFGESRYHLTELALQGVPAGTEE